MNFPKPLRSPNEQPPQPTDPIKLTPNPNTARKNLIIYLINNWVKNARLLGFVSAVGFFYA